MTLADKRGINGLYGKFAQAGLDLSPAYRSRLAAYYRSGGNLQLARGHKYKQEHILRRERNPRAMTSADYRFIKHQAERHRPLRDRKEVAFDMALAALRRIAKGDAHAATVADNALQHISFLTEKFGEDLL